MTPLIGLLIFALAVLGWWVIAAVADAFPGRPIHVPEQWVSRALDWLPASVHQGFQRARQLLSSKIQRKAQQ